MIMYGYEIRNEYGLGAAELYKTAYQDDPEAILEGVAVAGLVGFLRQLGDLAEFAAGLFHGLHEEITNTASRSQNIMLRVQQLEADLPKVEKDLFHDRDTDYASNEGISWHSNLDTDSNIVTKEEMPHYVMEFYKQSRGPPQLFRLDKFDKAGAGACLKRHTDPSFFRVNLSTYGITQGYQRETRTLKATRELNPISTDIARSLKMPQIVSRQEMGTKDQDMDELPIRHVKLKPKQFNGSLLGPMQNLLETDSPVHESFSRSIPYTSTELEKSSKSFTSDEKISTNAFHKQLKSLGSLINHNRNREDTSSSDEKDDSPSSELLSNSSTTQHYQTGSPPDQDTESDENSDEYISDATASEVEFLDALTTAIVDSEMETDSEVKDKNNPALVRIESKKFSSERKEERKDSTLLRSKNSFMRNDKDETEQVPTKSVAGTEAATAPFSDGDGGKSIHETESHYRTISFNKVVSKKVSDEEYEFNPATTNENGAKPKAKLEKDSFSHSLRHMAKQLLELKHELTEDEEEVDSQDPEENEDELLVDNAGVQESGIVEKDEYLVENVQTSNVTEVCNDLIAKDTETIQTEINSIATCLGEDQADLTSRENELHGLQNIESIKIEQLNTNKEFGDHEVHVSSDVMKDSEKADEISIDGTVTKNITMDRVSNYEMPEFENLHPTKMEELESGENLHVDETSVEENSEETDETLMDGMMADNLTRELHESEMAETQNLTLVDKEQDFVESEAYLGPCGMQHGEESYEIHGHGTVTKRSIKEEVFYNEMPDNQNLSSEGEELCESEMQHAKNETEKLINEEVFDGDVSETENTNSNEKELYESEMYVGLDGQTAETYELPVDGREIGKFIEAEDFDSGIAVFQIVNSIKNEEEFLENEMDVSSDDLQHGKEPYEIPTVSTIDENLDSEDALREISLQEQNVYHGDATQIPGSEYSLDEERTLSDNSAEPWDSHVDDGLSVKALGDRYELLEEEIQDTDIEPVSSRPLIKDNILREALLGSNEPLEEEEDGDKVDDRGGELPVPQVVGAAAEDESVNPVPEDPVTVLGTDIQDEAVTPVACNPEVISAPVDPVTDLETEILHEVVTTIACNSEIIPYRAIISPPIQSIAPTFNSVPGEGDIVPPLPPLPPIQWRMGKPQMGPLPSLGPMAPPAHSSKFVPLPNFSKLGRPPRPKSSKVAAKERKLHEVENEQIGENCEMIFNTEELQNCLMSPSLEKDTSTKGFASVENNPICNETIVRYEESPVRELSVKEEPLSSGDGNFEQEMKEEEPRKKPPTVPIPPKYPMFQVTSHDNSMLKKAPTLIQPASRLITPSMLEEIKNKSCCLKPVMVKRPNFMGPYSRTNLKVAAMLEKANAIRQAVGSDDSDNDSWSE